MNPYHHVGRFRSRRRWEHWFKSVTRMTIRHNNSCWVGAVAGTERSHTYFEGIVPCHTVLGAMPSNSVSSNIFTSLYYYAASTNYRVRNTKTYGF